jgi:hypothetical protein
MLAHYSRSFTLQPQPPQMEELKGWEVDNASTVMGHKLGH